MNFFPTSTKSVAMLCLFAMLTATAPAGIAQGKPPGGPPDKPPDGGGKPRRLPERTPPPVRAPQVISTPPKIQFVQPRSPFPNALTGPDQTWGMTGITLINELGDLNYRKSKGHRHHLQQKKSGGPEEFSVTGPRIEGDSQTYNPHKLTIPPDAIIIDTSDNLTGGGLVPIAYREPAASHPPIVVRVSAARSNLVLFNQDDQLSCGDISHGDKTLLMGSVGTTFSSTNKVVYLHAGRLLVDSAHEPVRIATKTVGVKVEPGSTVLFEYWPSKPIRIMALAKHHGPSAKVRVSFISGAPISLEPGQELLVSEGQIKPADLEPGDGVERKVLQETRPLTGGEVLTRSFSVQQFAPQVMLSPAQVRACSSQKAKAYERMVSHIAVHSSLPPSGQDSQAPASTWSADPVRMFAKDGTELMTESTGAVSLFSGSMLVRAPAGTRVKTDLGEIHVDDPAVLAVQSAPGAVRVDTCDGQGAVWALTGRHRIELNPGTELLLTDHTPSSEEAYARDGVGRRQVTATQLPHGISVVLSDFSIMSLLSNGKHLKTLKKPDTPTDSQLVDNVLSTAAILNLTTGSRGGFFAHPSQE